ncbi:pyruvate kinase [Paenibacillus thiaminolyticus]|uniref:pyruvate kinase n=1 Tax=Paenibacillus thiaminolyticus TaxID=49283 RepID=UPI00254303E3|nr:pyruvate kinase [Paenibacillus thiaminolyticus]WII37329.1 pyruvate kinase [Paenibacillus thiaminolyticus]
MQLDVTTLYEKYLALHIPNPFTLRDIDERLKTAYYAEEADLRRYESLRSDPDAYFETAVKAYTFRDRRGIEQLLKLNPDNSLHSYRPNGFHYIINSEDGIHPCGGTRQGMSYMLSLENGIFYGIDPSEMILGNERFEDYLKALYLTGYIQLDNDPLLEQAHARYRAGYTLKWYGMTDGIHIF